MFMWCMMCLCVFQSGSGSPVSHRSAGLRLGLPPPPSSSSSSHTDTDSKRSGADQSSTGRTRRVSRVKSSSRLFKMCLSSSWSLCDFHWCFHSDNLHHRTAGCDWILMLIIYWKWYHFLWIHSRNQRKTAQMLLFHRSWDSVQLSALV